MLDWYNYTHLLLLLSGYLLLIVLPKRFRVLRPWLAFGLLTGAAVLLFLQEPFNDQATFFKGNGFIYILSLIMLLHLLLTQLNVLLDKSAIYSDEFSSLQIAFAFLSVALLFANHMAVQVLALPAIISIAFMAPRFLSRSSGRKVNSLFQGINWSLLAVILMGISCALWYESQQSLLIDVIRENLGKEPLKPSEFMASAASLSTFLLLIFLGNTPIALEEFENAKDWSVFGYFRMGLSLLGTLLIFRWVFNFAGHWEGMAFLDRPGTPNFLILSSIFFILAIWIILQSFFGRKLSLLTQALVLQPLLLSFWGLALGYSLAFHAALAALFLFSIAAPTFVRILTVSNLKLSDDLSTAAAAMRKVSFWERIQLFGLLVIMTPLGSFLGFALFVRPSRADEITRFAAIGCAAALSISMLLIAGQLFTNRESVEKQTSGIERIVGFGLLISLIVLGIYPSPLYNYLIKTMGIFR